MSFFKKLFGGGPARHQKRYYTFHVRCDRCNETIEGRVDLDNDLSLNDEGDGYFARKVLMGENRCFQQIEVTIQFTSARELTEQNIQGGKFVE